MMFIDISKSVLFWLYQLCCHSLVIMNQNCRWCSKKLHFALPLI